MLAKDRTGLIGEQRAATFLQERGHTVLARRWRTPTGELDLVTQDSEELVAVEVKTRRGTGFGHPLEAVSDQKLRRLHKLLAEYAAARSHRSVKRRVDVVGVLIHSRVAGSDDTVIDHLKDL